MGETFDLAEHMAKRTALVDKMLDELLPKESEPPEALHKAMRYAVFSGGKRLRPTLVLDACEAVGGDVMKALPAACAIELIHTYSLVHDDLPCIDNDDVRRGMPTCHKVFGEAIALLCGDALLTLAFEVLSKEQMKVGVATDVAIETIGMIAEAVGHLGMVGGQVMDVEAQSMLTRDMHLSEELIREIHKRKTGALITVAVEVGAMIGGASVEQRKALRAYAHELGIAFQITDDLLDAEGNHAKKGEPNIATVLGIERSRQLATEAVERAIENLACFGERALPLRAIAEFVLLRKR
jgi:geranylgeranyl diphosphate synthase type II